MLMVVLILLIGFSLISFSSADESNNTAPTLYQDFGEIVLRNDLTYRLNLSEHYSDPDAEELTYQILESEGLTIVFNSDEMVITANADFLGLSVVRIRVNDTYVTRTDDISVYVTAANPPPPEDETNATGGDNSNESDNSTEEVNVSENSPPEIVEGQEENVSALSGENVSLSVVASDADEDELSYSWYVDGELVYEEGNEYEFSGLSVGEHLISVLVNDGTSTIEKSWNVFVEEGGEIELWLVIAGVIFVIILIAVVIYMSTGIRNGRGDI